MAFARIVQSWFQAWSRSRSLLSAQASTQWPAAATRPFARAAMAQGAPTPGGWTPTSEPLPQRVGSTSPAVHAMLRHTCEHSPAGQAGSWASVSAANGGTEILSPTMAIRRQAANDPCIQVVRPLKIRYAQGHTEGARLAISGRLADVCAELDRLAQLEQRSGTVGSAA